MKNVCCKLTGLPDEMSGGLPDCLGSFHHRKNPITLLYTISTLHQKYTKNFQFHRLISLPKSFNFEIHRELHYRKVKVQNI